MEMTVAALCQSMRDYWGMALFLRLRFFEELQPVCCWDAEICMLVAKSGKAALHV